MKAAEMLALLHDVPGVAGSCLVDSAGQILIRDIPPEIPDDMMSGVARRCRAALMAANLTLTGSDHVVLRFERLTVSAKATGDNLILVLGDPDLRTTLVRTAARICDAALAEVTEPVETAVDDPPVERRRREHDVWG